MHQKQSEIAFFKIPPELLKYVQSCSGHFYPANYAQYKAFNVDLYRSLSPNFDYPQELLPLKVKQQKTLARDCFRLLPRDSIFQSSTRLAKAFAWGTRMARESSKILAWNKYDIESKAMAAGGAKIIWLENGFARSTHIYCEGEFDLPQSPSNRSVFPPVHHQKYSTPFNAADLLFDYVDRSGCAAYYSQIFFKNLRRLQTSSRPPNHLAGKKLVFLAQLDFDANTIVNGRGYNFLSALSLFQETATLYEGRGIGSKLSSAVRLHPNSSPIYKYDLSKKGTVDTDYSHSIEDCANEYDAAITINSSAATAFIAMGKPVIFLGEGELPSCTKHSYTNDANSIVSYVQNFSKEAADQAKNQLGTLISDKHISKDELCERIAAIDH